MSTNEFYENFNWLAFANGALVSSLLLALAHLFPRSRRAQKATNLLYNYAGFMAINEWGLLVRYTYGTISLIIGLTIFFTMSGLLPLVFPFIGMAIIAGGARALFALVVASINKCNVMETKLEMLENEQPELTQ